MAPAWALTGGGGFPQPLRPPALADIALWYKGDAGLNSSGGLVTTWEDQGALGLDLGAIGITPTPEVGNDSIDGIPCINGGLLSSSDAMLGNVTPLFSHAVPRTVMAMFRPRYAASGFGITGGPVFCSIDTGLPQFVWTNRFELDDNFGANRYYVLGANGLAANDGPSTVGGAFGPFNGIPTLGTWLAVDSAVDISAHRNGGSSLVITPTTPVNEGATLNVGFRVFNGRDGGRNFFGSLAELIVWGNKILDSDELVQGNAYFAQRYPSAPIVIA
jgi:hypothetical protein